MSMNEVLNGIRRNQEDFPDQQHYVTFVTFEGEGVKGVKTRRDRVPVSRISDISEKDYRPGGCTPLYDAIGMTLHDLEGKINKEDRVMATIITDGYENASSEYSGRIIINLLDRLRDKGWTIAYIGANQDAIEVARDLHIDNALNYDATPEGVEEMGSRFSKATKRVSRLYDYMPAGTFMACPDIFDEDDN